jgi:ACS family hexuronate transporter-like MFS transporter
MLGGIGGMVMAKSVGFVLETIGGYGPIFAVAGVIYFLAVLVVHLLSPKLATVTV